MKFPQHLLDYRRGKLALDGVDLEEIGREHGTPLFVYSGRKIRESLRSFHKGAGDRSHLVCFAMKSNSNLSILRLVGEEGGGTDIVSGGELYRARAAGVPMDRVVFSGVGKTRAEMEAGLKADILFFVIESEGELRELNEAALALGKIARISIRVNPDVDAGTHPYISTGLKENKFGISHHEIPEMYKLALSLPGIEPVSIGFHIGSQLTELAPFQDAAGIVLPLVEKIRGLGVKLRYIDVGGGLGINYNGESPPSPEEYVRAIMESVNLPELTVVFEPGRSLVGNAGVFLTRILYVKENEGKRFYICDGAMNDLLRPALYQAYHDVLPLREIAPGPDADLVGPVCETGDFLARDRELPAFQPGDWAALTSAGAYGFVMASNYNTRPRAAEILVENGKAELIRRRETYEDLVRGEVLT